MNKETTPPIDQEYRVPASAKDPDGRRDYSAFRLNALSLNADLAALGSADPSEPPTHWIMATDHLPSMVKEVAANMKALAQLQGVPVPGDDQLMHVVMAELGYAHAARPAGALAHLRFVFQLTVRCIARSVALQAEIASASRRGRQSA